MPRTMSQAFDEWMRRYIEEPEQYQREFQSVLDFEADEAAGAEPRYGKTCEAYLQKLMTED